MQGITLIKANPSFIEIATGSGTVVVHLPHHPKVKGLSPVATTAYTGREKNKGKSFTTFVKDSRVGFKWNFLSSCDVITASKS